MVEVPIVDKWQKTFIKNDDGTYTLRCSLTKLNPSLTITESTVDTVTTKTIVKTIGSTQYQKTITTDSSDNSIIISEWSQI